ncbi:M20 family metallo-hydrolase [Haloferula sp. BvORR071]|uniref:M20 family metallo-hydrolase n=1 Tax=Haloferula sp. BvORR071 TaxID=1396141 RepID=UPI0005595DA3|nr:M20 family metallo-hydrolase [Haloferula sp. BvORR071]
MKSLEEALGSLLERIEALGEVTDTPGALTRTFLSRANQEAAKLVGWWMAGAGMAVSHDAGGSVRGVLAGVPGDQWSVIGGKAEAEEAPDESRLANGDARPLVLGSHIDTVIDAGKYDGALGVLIAIAALEVTGPLAFPVHVLGFSDEEGVRFHATYLGSRACVGPLEEEILELRDAEGISLRDALAEARLGRLREGEQWRMDEEAEASEGVAVEAHRLGAWRGEVAEFLYRPGECRGYVEVHIEQGRVLEDLGEPVCVVSGISGQSRLMVTLRGQTDHAGTTPMHLRKDALAGAAECVLAVERLAKEPANVEAGLMATVGKLTASPGATNAIPGEVRFSLDFRHPEDAERERLLELLLGQFGDIAAARGLEAFAKVVQANAAVPCDPALTERLLDAVEPLTGRRHLLPSGAGHDGVMMSRAMPIAMMFVRCKAGLSHHPDEYASPGDVAVALRGLVDFLKSVG